MWSAEDPRDENADRKRTDVVISNGARATVGHCEMKHGWSVLLDEMLDGRTTLSEREVWPAAWKWTHLPGNE